jgi:hypothetical protein
LRNVKRYSRKTKVRYAYAPLDSIVEQTRDLIAKYGLSYSFKTTNDEKNITATLRITHIIGHSEENSFVVPIGTEGYMSDVQKYGARRTFAERYAFCDGFGILTGDEDTDATPESLKKDDVPTVQDAVVVDSSKELFEGFKSEMNTCLGLPHLQDIFKSVNKAGKEGLITKEQWDALVVVKDKVKGTF